MDLNLFQNLKKDIESNTTIKKFIDELSNFLKDTTSSVTLTMKIYQTQKKTYLIKKIL